MNLYLNDTSPFSRVVLVTAVLCQYDELTLTWVDPWQSPTLLTEVNPFNQIPVLRIDGSVDLTESLCICQWLIANRSTNTAKPIVNHQQITTLDWQSQEAVALMGVAKGLMEIAFRTAALARFSEQDHVLIERGHIALLNALKKLELSTLDNIDGIAYQANLPALYLYIALEYVQFRHSEIFNEHVGPRITQFLNLSPFRQVAEKITIQGLSSQPSFTHLIS